MIQPVKYCPDSHVSLAMLNTKLAKLKFQLSFNAIKISWFRNCVNLSSSYDYKWGSQSPNLACVERRRMQAGGSVLT